MSNYGRYTVPLLQLCLVHQKGSDVFFSKESFFRQKLNVMPFTIRHVQNLMMLKLYNNIRGYAWSRNAAFWETFVWLYTERVNFFENIRGKL